MEVHSCDLAASSIACRRVFIGEMKELRATSGVVLPSLSSSHFRGNSALAQQSAPAELMRSRRDDSERYGHTTASGRRRHAIPWPGAVSAAIQRIRSRLTTLCGPSEWPPPVPSRAPMTTDPQPPRDDAVRTRQAEEMVAGSSVPNVATQESGHQRGPRVLAAEVSLLYQNATTSVVVSVLIALLLAYAHRRVHAPIVFAWLLFVVAVALTRLAIAWRYWRTSQDESAARRWMMLFVAGTQSGCAFLGGAATARRWPRSDGDPPAFCSTSPITRRRASC